MLYAAILIFDATLVLTHSRKVHIVEKVSRSLSDFVREGYGLT